jgi:ribosomal protein S16
MNVTDDRSEEWQRKGATLSDKTARMEFGLTQDEIYEAIDAGTLQYRQA